MDSVKGKIISLESKIKDLEVKMNSLTGVSPMIEKNNHHVFPSEEFIECNLFEELQTLKFAYVSKIDHGKTEKKYYEYSLLNPTEEIEEILETETLRLMSFCDSPEKIEDYGYEIITGVQGPLLHEKNRKKLKQELDKYFFQVADICTCNQRPTLFPQDITIRFRNEYECLPHVSYYLTPIQECSKVKILVKEITNKQVVFTFTQHHTKGERCILPADQYKTPNDINLHLYVKGIQKKVSIDILLE